MIRTTTRQSRRTGPDVGDELRSIKEDLEHLRNWKRKIEQRVELVEAQVLRLEAQRELRLAGGGKDVGSTDEASR